jgi:FtsP/CotA-like multicopper oxidase with cupredoxin domain
MRFSKTPPGKIMNTTITAKLALHGLSLLALLPVGALAQNPCERFPQGSVVQEPEDLYSKNGVLKVDFTYQTSQDDYGKTLYCFVNSDGAQSPTLHVRPGDTLVLTLTNLVPEGTGKMPEMPGMDMSRAGEGGCGAMNMTDASVNLHYHGTNTPPVCHQDEVIRTIINFGQTFRYEVHFPKNEPAGLYWYHPHIHGISTAAVQGGATGALIVEGIENVNPIVAGLPQHVILVRDNQPVNPPPGPLHRPRGSKPADDDAAADLSVNYIPVGGPAFIPALFEMKPGEKQFWRIVNSAAVSILDLHLTYDGVDQPLEIVGLDGVPLGSQNGLGKPTTLTQTHLLMPPAGRAEIIVTGPGPEVKVASFTTAKVDTGPGGDPDPARPLFNIVQTENGSSSRDVTTVPASSGPPPPQRFPDLAKATPATNRKLYFSEDEQFFYITVDGQTPRPYSMDAPPAITTTQGSTEDWVIENRSNENHEFHIHQIHFLLMERNGKPVGPKEGQILDTVDLPYWSGIGPYPSIKVRMDFRGPDIGDFVYHCHILDHEDGGMMAIIRVLPKTLEATDSALE